MTNFKGPLQAKLFYDSCSYVIMWDFHLAF